MNWLFIAFLINSSLDMSLIPYTIALGGNGVMKVEILDMIVTGDDGVIGRSSGKGYSLRGDE